MSEGGLIAMIWFSAALEMLALFGLDGPCNPLKLDITLMP